MTRSETRAFRNDRGLELSGRLDLPDDPVAATAVFAHCFTCSNDLRSQRLLTRGLAERGIAVLSFDFAGLGTSEGEFAESTFSADVDDLVTAAEHVTEALAPPTLLVGHSIGGAKVLAAARRLDSVRAVATIAAPADLDHVTELFEDELGTIRGTGEAEVVLAGRTFTIRSSFVDDLAAHDLTAVVGDLDAALLLLHSPTDRLVGIEHAARLFQAARHPRSFVALDGADHLLQGEGEADYAAAVIAAWASHYLPRHDAAATP